MIKSGYIWKTKNCTKNHLCKIWASGQFKYTIEIWQVLKKVEFLSAQNAPFGRPWCPNAIRNSTPIIFFSSLRIFYVKMTTSEGGVGVCISVVGTGLRIHYELIQLQPTWTYSTTTTIQPQPPWAYSTTTTVSLFDRNCQELI